MFFCRHLAILGAAALGVAIAASGRTSQAARADYVGSERCGTCHPAALAVWKKSAHARASETLGARVANRACLACHATGDAPAGRPYASGVGCESCHGAGAGYAEADVMRSPVLAEELGLRPLSAPTARTALCNSCHRKSTRIAGFDADAAWRKIAH